ncbi:MAG: phosphoribosylamine--glycine ligase [Anaerolineales bacterium]|nr:phosphoribosylamine--glycine ligase [Anaerolineales bacterium]
MNILVIGSGGREHAITWKVCQSPKADKVFVLPGNPGTSLIATNVEDVSVEDHVAVASFCKANQVDLVIVGPEVPLAGGLVDSLSEAGIHCFGPKQASAEIEASKVFSKDFMARHNIPTAKYFTFTRIDEATRCLQSIDYPIVIKASGLAAGKGVILPKTDEEATSALEDILTKKIFGDAGMEVVVEERMTGPEVSLMAFTDGTTVVPMVPAQDHKRLLDGDNGPNTGGMGAYAPAPVFTDAMLQETIEKVLQPAVDGLRNEGRKFVGVLYAGLMLTPNGIRVLEFNCRFGDPETQVVLPLLETDLVEIAEACVDGRLKEVNIRWKSGAAVCIVLASKGYPEKPEKGQVVSFGKLPEDMICFHAGTKQDGANVLTAGGRVFGLAAWSGDIASVVEKVYANIDKVEFDGMQYRKDIAHRALEGAK